jgi:bacteriocin biosynthesis cyclodehydratase domain-containing protein
LEPFAHPIAGGPEIGRATTHSGHYERPVSGYRIPSYFDLTVISEREAIIWSPRDKIRVSGGSVRIVKRLFERKGAPITSELIEQLPVGSDRALEIVERLRSQGVVVRMQDASDGYADEHVGFSRNDVLFVDRTGANPDGLLDRFDVDVTGTLPGADSLAGIDALVVISRGESPDLNTSAQESCFASRTAFLPVRLVGPEVRVGPLTVQENGPCYDCYYSRHIASTTDGAVLDRLIREERASAGHVSYAPHSTDLAQGFGVSEISNLLSEERSARSRGAVIVFDEHALSTANHDVLQVPHCQLCNENRT